ncbi:MAG: DUF2202 domain-containing protein [Gammaproteobacteria bacterium]|nr:DUF2202 domain-containing protein [Gammaproteobacteria bacterium]
MKNLNTYLIAIFFFILASLTAGCNSEDAGNPTDVTAASSDGSTSFDETKLDDALTALPLEDLSADEIAGLEYMREEEKLARDTYITMFDIWGINIFDNISNSEQTHTDAVLALLEKYGIADPVGDNDIGLFVDEKLQNLYDTLIAQGSASLIDALLVGAAIEEIDIIDIQVQLDNYVDNQDIALVYSNLLKGSRNHLRSFTSSLEKQGIIYQPQYLSQQAYDEIVSSAMETN